MKKKSSFILLGVFCIILQSCHYFPYEPETFILPYLSICKFNDSCEVYHDNAWINAHNDPRPWEWLQKPYPLGDGYYMWTHSGRCFLPENVLFLSTTREEWNAGNQSVDDSLVVFINPYDEDYIFIFDYQDDIVDDHITIAEEDTIAPPHNKYIKWADTAWFRKKVLDRYISNPNHSIDLDSVK